ncbi:hypothetical protein N9B72_00410 [Bacteriovoracaceae bacterium]|nr:hypothetical protein [Bacteriovoracaceae bacterium]MDA9793021.1 hypothetical protein [Bacteriovoracaceae bacterium]
MENGNVINLADARKKSTQNCGQKAYKRYLRLLETDQLETEVNYILDTVDIAQNNNNITLPQKSELILNEIASRATQPMNEAILAMKSETGDELPT